MELHEGTKKNWKYLPEFEEVLRVRAKKSIKKNNQGTVELTLGLKVKDRKVSK